MLSMASTVSLVNGVQMPLMGLGVYQIDSDSRMVSAVACALDAGYRAFDTATAYGNERALGQALRQAGIARERLFITSKLSRHDTRAGCVRQAFFESLERLRTDYLDLYLIHWPVRGYIDAWMEMTTIYAEGHVRAIGVSNCLPTHLDELKQRTGCMPMVDQMEYHPWQQQRETLAYCRAAGIVLEGYGPFMQGRLLRDERIQTLAEAHGISVTQLLLRWSLDNGVPTIPKSSVCARIHQNADLFGFTLDAQCTAALTAMNRDLGSLPGPYTFW